MTLSEIARRIKQHLKNAERDPSNKLWNSGAYASGRYAYVIYVSYQGRMHLTKDEALRYLRWLDDHPDASDFKRHHDVFRESGRTV